MRTRITLAAAAALAAFAAAPAQAAFPGANGKLVFQRAAGNQLDLVTVAPDGTGARTIAGTGRFEEEAQWSPDGQRIAYALSGPGGSPTEIVTVDANGGDLRRVTKFGSFTTAPSWSPTGDRLVFFSLKDYAPPREDRPPPPSDLYTAGVDGSSVTRVTNDRKIQLDPVWSPDGRTIAYAQFKPVPGRPGVVDMAILLRDADGSNPRQLTKFSPYRDTFNPSWSPDGRSIVFEVARPLPGRRTGERQSDLAVIDADGTGERQLTRTAALETNPAWSPDGRFVAFSGDVHVKRGPRERQGPKFEIYTMAADGSAITRLTRNRVADFTPDWQPLP